MPHDPETARAPATGNNGPTRTLATIIDPEGNPVGLAGQAQATRAATLTSTTQRFSSGRNTPG